VYIKIINLFLEFVLLINFPFNIAIIFFYHKNIHYLTTIKSKKIQQLLIQIMQLILLLSIMIIIYLLE